MFEPVRRQVQLFLMLLHRRAYTSPRTQREIIDSFHRLYYDSYVFDKTWSQTRWLGTLVLKCPFDLWIYQELIYQLKPGLIVETGTSRGGSASYMACLCDLVGQGRIMTIDVEEKPDRPQHP